MCGQHYPLCSDAECCHRANSKPMLYAGEFTRIPSTHPVHVYTSCGFVPRRDRATINQIIELWAWINGSCRPLFNLGCFQQQLEQLSSFLKVC